MFNQRHFKAYFFKDNYMQGTPAVVVTSPSTYYSIWRAWLSMRNRKHYF